MSDGDEGRFWSQLSPRAAEPPRAAVTRVSPATRNMLTVNTLAPPLQRPNISFPKSSRLSSCFAPDSTFFAVPIRICSVPKARLGICKVNGNEEANFLSQTLGGEIGEDEDDEFSARGRFRLRGEVGEDGEEEEVVEDDGDGGFASRGGFRKGDKDYDRDPEFAEILGTVLDDPEKAQKKMEERFKKKKNNILHTKTGSATPMKVLFNKFDFSNSYIWFEFYNIPLQKDISLIRDAIRAWYVVGCLGGCNSMNMQLSQSPMDSVTPKYDDILGANVEPATFYNIGNFEVQYNLARVWVDVGTSEPLLLDILINALTQISSDYVGIKQVVFGGSEYETWNENLTTEEAGYSVHKI